MTKNETNLKIMIGKKDIIEPIGFKNSIIIEDVIKFGAQRQELLRLMKTISLSLQKNNQQDSQIEIKMNSDTNNNFQISQNEERTQININTNVIKNNTGFLSIRRFVNNQLQKKRIDEIPKKRKDVSKVLPNGKRSKVLIFKNILNSFEKEQCEWFSPGSLYIASSLKKVAIVLHAFPASPLV